MEFKRVQFLKKQMARKMDTGGRFLTEQEVFAMDALTLAYMGDVCWSFYIREKLIGTGIHHVQILSALASEMVSARWQSRILFELRELLSERELSVCRRGRNTHSSVPKSATVEEYRESTAFESLMGYLYFSGQKERQAFLMDRAMKYLAQEINP